MSPRFIFDALVLTLGAFLAGSAFAFSATATYWLALVIFAVSIIGAVATVVSERNALARTDHVLIGLVGLWSFIATLAFTGSAFTWLVLVGAAVIAVLALGDLVGHEVTTERVVHQLDVRHAGPVAA
jgi:hypothetical protein